MHTFIYLYEAYVHHLEEKNYDECHKILDSIPPEDVLKNQTELEKYKDIVNDFNHNMDEDGTLYYDSGTQEFLYQACDHGRLDLAKKAFHKFKNICFEELYWFDEPEFPFNRVCLGGLEIVKWWLSKFMDKNDVKEMFLEYENEENMECINNAASKGHNDLLKFLFSKFSKDLDIHDCYDIKYNNALSLACKNGHPETVDLLIFKFGKENFDLEREIKLAELRNKVDVLDCLKKYENK